MINLQIKNHFNDKKVAFMSKNKNIAEAINNVCEYIMNIFKIE